MRSLKAERKPSRRGRSKQARRTTTGSRIQLDRLSFGTRKGRKNPLSRFVGDVRAALAARRPMLVLTLVLIALTAVFGLFAGGYVGRAITGTGNAIDAVVADSGFAVSAIHVTGNRRTPPRMVLAALGFEPGQQIFSADLWHARDKLMHLDWVADAQIRRVYPDEISVSIVEKKPYALWKAPDGFYVVERNGRIITSRNLEDFAHLPVLIGAGANTQGAALEDAIARRRAVAARVQEVERISDRRWDLILDDRVRVKLPETGWQNELDTLEHLIVDKAILERDVGEIDLRSPDNYIFILRNGRQQQAPREKST